jgi:hypothetical protein
MSVSWLGEKGDREAKAVVGFHKQGAWAAAAAGLSLGSEQAAARLRELEAWVATVGARTEAARVAVVMTRWNSGSFGLVATRLHKLYNLRCGKPWHGLGRQGGRRARRARRILFWTCSGRRRGASKSRLRLLCTALMTGQQGYTVVARRH